MGITVQPLKPHIGGVVQVDRKHLCDAQTADAVRAALEERGVLVFPQLDLSDDEQLAFTDSLGARLNFTRSVPGSDASARDVYKVTLDKEINDEPDYVLGTFFWHIDGMTTDIPLPKATLLSARRLPLSGAATEFANLYAAYDFLSEQEKRDLDDHSVIHTLEAGLRPVHGHPSQERIERWRAMAPIMEHPLVWRHASGRKSLLVGAHADLILGMPGPHGRALLWRLQQWAAQPDFVYRHEWQIGDLVIWNNEGLMHRAVPYTDSDRVMHRTSIAGIEKPGRVARAEAIAKLAERVA